MKKLILLFLMLLLLIGGTGGSLKLLELGPFKPKKGEVSKNIFLKQKKDTTVFIDMDPLAIPIFQGNKVAATIQILVKTGNQQRGQRRNHQGPNAGHHRCLCPRSAQLHA